MKIRNFRVRNYKSIMDSGTCWLASDVTILAGKNESGKTAVLEALHQIYTAKAPLASDTRPIGFNAKEPELSICFALLPDEIDDLSNKAKVKISEAMLKKIEKAGLTTIYTPETFDLVDVDDGEIASTTLALPEESREAFSTLAQFASANGISIPETIDSQGALDLYFLTLTERNRGLDEPNPDVNAKISEIQALTDDKHQVQDARERFRKVILDAAPSILFFSDFDDVVPFSISFEDAQKNATVRSIAGIAGLDIDALAKTSDDQERINLLDERSAEISGDFGDTWEQDRINIVFDFNGNNLIIGIREHGSTKLFKVTQRSRGLQWFMSFYARLRDKKDKQLIILIDEPGLYLHSKAQKDILRVLTALAKNNQIMISTHSPYLIDSNRLDRIRLVTKTKTDGTTLENKIHRGADAETLSPVLTAIGLDVKDAISLSKQHNLIVEGISDSYILRGMALLLSRNTFLDVHVIPAVGASRILDLAALLRGWDVEYLALFDNDQEGRKRTKALMEQYEKDQAPTVYVSETRDLSIEDLFSRTDFDRYFLEDRPEINREGINNSRAVKDVDKVLLSKIFYEKALAGTLSAPNDETRDNFETLLNSIEKFFKLEPAA